ncbi:hypothetical protein C2S53_018111 [Perilla frutescens var. hirtella]|uniref:Peptidase C14 caspase domain-containing protein n=1 Tax=Perilla frutescens var. hirtella TaxID=608512 RepID=A0AAD4PC04_PERFH|nr:hypothetical protein C2S53_018111 [Perilla frutescens var. hirtella]
MAIKRQCCSWCGMVSLVPLEAQSLHCPACRRFTMLQRNHNYGNANFTYATNQGYAGNVRPYTAIVYQSPPPPPSHVHGRKRALLCGITYKGHRQTLNGSINDVVCMKKLLVERFHFPASSILVLTEEEEDYYRIPTKRNIRNALRWLVQGCQSGDSLVFHYSGHGSQVRDRDGDERDGYDESLLPVDYDTEGRILDDEINATIVRPLPRGAMLHAIIDTCFSGTFLDLTNVCRLSRDAYYKWEDQRIPNSAFKGTSGGFAISITACDDHQNSGDTTAFTGTATGALTYSFVQTLQQGKRLTYGNLLTALHHRIGAGREAAGLTTNDSHALQEPQLSSSHKFDIHSKNFTL